MVVAERAMAAQDAGEFVHVEYEPLTPVTDARDALKPGAPQIWPEAPNNLAVDWPGPAADPAANAAEVERIFASAKHVARITRNESAPLRRLDGAARRHRELRRRARRLYAAHLLAERRHHARQHSRHHELAEGEIARHHRRRRRRVRAENLGLSGIHGALDGGEETRPPGALDVGPLGSVSVRQSGARYLFGSGAGARRQGQIPGACASAASAIWAPISAPSAPISRR